MKAILPVCYIACLFFQHALAVLQFTQEPTDQAVLLTQPLWWHCIARASIGSQEPAYTWLFGGEPILGGDAAPSVFTNGTLYVASVDDAVLGDYRCRVQSGVQTLESGTVTLALATLGVAFSTNPSSVTQNLGSALTLRCSISSIPMATITWQLNGEDVTTATDITSSVSGSVTTSEVQIDSLDHEHGGQYRCLATNRLLIGLTRYSQLGEVTLIGRPGFSVTPEPITVIVGGTATFNCEANGSPVSTVDWLNPQDNAITTGGRFTATSTRLTITNSQKADGGYYTCRATNAWGGNTATALLTVSDLSQEIVFTKTPTDESEVEGGRVTFPCNARGNPSPTIAWSKDDGDLPSNRIQEPAAGWLRITDIQTSDSGFYVCTASNSITTVTSRVQLIVQVSPSFTTQPEDSTLQTGETALFNCNADGVPTPAISWTTPLPELGMLGVSSGLQSGVEVLSNSSLVIPVIENRHAGTYSCSATNTVSSASCDATLTVRSSPVITSSPTDQMAIEGNLAQFACRATAIPTPVISWVFNDRRLATDLKFEVLGNGDLRINNVEDSQEGFYTCSTENELGVRNVSAYLTVYVPPQFIMHPVDLVVDLGSRVVLDCEASGDPAPSIQWQKDGGPLVLETNIEVLSNSTIVIDNLTEVNTGEYTCIATNLAGSNQVTAILSTPDIPKFTVSPSNTTGNETYPVNIMCRATAREAPSISWYLSDAAGNRGDRIGLGTNPPTTRGQQSFVSLSGDLEFRQVMVRDAGWYECEAENSAGSVSGTAYLSVNVPPTVESTNSPVSTVEGSSFALLNCGFSGQPAPSVMWTLPNGDAVPDDQSLYSQNNQNNMAFLVVYNPVVSDHDGAFICSVSNFLGTDNSSVQLIVQGAPVLTLVQATLAEDGSITLRCDTKGSPTPSITWLRGAITLPDSSLQDHSLTPDDQLVITDLAAAESGLYTCNANNTHGLVSGVLQGPGDAQAPSITSIESTSIGLNWDPPTSTSDLSITSYVVQYKAQEDDEYSLAGETGDMFLDVRDLEPYTGYQFRVQAVNGLGAGSFSPPTSQETAQGVPSRPLNVEAVVTANLITVSWDEPESLNGNPDNIVYEVMYYVTFLQLDGETITISHNANQLEALLDDLDFEADYEVKVRAGNSVLGEWSQEVTLSVRTGIRAPMTSVTGFKAAANSTTTIWLTWQPTDDATFEAYLISYRVLNSSDMSPDFVLPAQGASTYLIVGLVKETQYAVSIAYQNAGGLSPFTDEIIVATLSEPVVARSQAGGVDGGIIAAIVCGILAVIFIILAFVAFGIYWKRKNDDWTGQTQYNADSLWINRRNSQDYVTL